jgi:AraC-like DNA-binding protein
MGVFFWQYDLDPEFPICVLEHTTYGKQDRIHWHDYLQIALCTEGKGKYIFTHDEYDIKAGDLFIIDNFESHAAIAEQDGHVKFLFVIFLPELIATPGCRQFDFEYLSPFWYDAKTFRNKINGTTKTARKSTEIMYTLDEVWKRKESGYQHMMDANLKIILGLLIHHYRTTDPGNFSSDIHRHVQIIPALNFIKRHYAENITLKEVSATVHISESRFRHLFKEVTRMRFKEYVTILRITEAKKLLMSTDRIVADVANQVGYSNLNHFYKSFRKYASMSPGEYRNYYL